MSLNIVHTEHDHWKAIHLGIFSWEKQINVCLHWLLSFFFSFIAREWLHNFHNFLYWWVSFHCRQIARYHWIHWYRQKFLTESPFSNIITNNMMSTVVNKIWSWKETITVFDFCTMFHKIESQVFFLICNFQWHELLQSHKKDPSPETRPHYCNTNA